MLYKEEDSYNAFDSIIQALKESINCALPCRVESVNGNYVDVLMIRNDEIEDTVISNVPVKRPETQRAYIFLGLRKGDRGTLTFYDKSISDYVKGDEGYNGETRCHSIQDRSFSLGFVPDNEAYVYPSNADIEIGLKDGSAKINLTNGIITLAGQNLQINAPNSTIQGDNITISSSNVSIGSNTTIDGKVFLEHTHSNGNQGSPTGGVI